MFGQAEDDAAISTEHANTVDELENMAGDSREQQSTKEVADSTIASSESVTETELIQENSIEVDNQPEDDLVSGTKNKNWSASSDLQHASSPSTTTIPTTTSSPPQQTTKFTFGKVRRRPFRPLVARARSQKSDIISESEKNNSYSQDSIRPWTKPNREFTTTTSGPRLTTKSIPVKSHRLRLFNAENRLNYLRKKTTPSPREMQESSEIVTDTPEMQTSEILVPVPITMSKKTFSRVDKVHRFMIEQVRFMLAQDTKRYAMVPVHSAFSTMAVAGVVPKPFVEDDVVEPQLKVNEILHSTEEPHRTFTTEETARPFRGRKRYRFAGLRTSSTTSEEPAIVTPKSRASKSRPLESARSNDIDLKQDVAKEELNSNRHKYQRRTRRVNETNNELELPPSGPADKESSEKWSEQFPPTWVTEPIIVDQYRSINETVDSDHNLLGAPTMTLPTFLQAWSQFLPEPFWSSTPSTSSVEAEENIDEDTTSDDDPAPISPTDSVDPKPTRASWFSSANLLRSMFWSSSRPATTQTDGGSSSRESSESEHPKKAINVDNRKLPSDDEIDFSGLVTYNDKMEPLQIVGPIPKFNPPNDAGHIEFELPLETGEIVLI